MGFFSGIVRSRQKRGTLRRIGQAFEYEQLRDDEEPSVFASFDKRQGKIDAVLEVLFHLCESDPDITTIMREHDATRETLKEVFTELLLDGAGQWAKGHFVAASALAYAPSLAYCLQEGAKGYPSKVEMAYSLVRYFEGKGDALKNPGTL